MRRLGLAAVLLLACACSGPAPAPAAPTTTAPVSAAPSSDPQICAAAPGTVALVRQIAEGARQGPVLPAAVALFLLDARQRAGIPAADPALRAAQAQMLAAIDDLDAQGRAELPPGGNPAKDAVRLDPTRVLAAAAAMERACAALSPPATGR